MLDGGLIPERWQLDGGLNLNMDGLILFYSEHWLLDGGLILSLLNAGRPHSFLNAGRRPHSRTLDDP